MTHSQESGYYLSGPFVAVKPSVRGLVFCSEMVEAFLSGRKTMTRRIIKCREASYAPGDNIYVKETVYLPPAAGLPQYTAGLSFTDLAEARRCLPRLGWAFRSSRFMPRAYARIWRKVTAVREERPQAISYEDIIAEGWTGTIGYSEPFGHSLAMERRARQWWKNLWIRLHGSKSWDANPQVWVLTLSNEVREGR